MLSYIYRERVREFNFPKARRDKRERYRGGRDREKKRLPGILIIKTILFKIERDIFQKKKDF